MTCLLPRFYSFDLSNEFNHLIFMCLLHFPEPHEIFFFLTICAYVPSLPYRQELLRGDRLEVKLSNYPMPTINRSVTPSQLSSDTP